MAENSAKFAFTWIGQPGVGWADGDALTIEYDEDSAVAYSGVKGEGDTVYSASNAATITARIQGGSPAQKRWVEYDKGLKTGNITDVPLFIAEKTSGDQVTRYTGTCALARRPRMVANRDKSVYEFVFKSSDCEMVVV